MAEKTNLMTPREFAAHLGFRPHYGHQLLKDGRLVLAPDGKNVLVAESIARMQETADPALGATVARHAAARAAAKEQPQQTAGAVDNADDGADDAPLLPSAGNAGETYQQARAVKERFLALEAKRSYEVAIGQLRDAREVEAVAATAMTELRLRLENLASTIAPVIAAEPDESRVRAMLQDEFARALESASNHFVRLASTGVPNG